MSNEYVFPDGPDGPLVRWSVENGAVHKDGRRVLTLSRVQKVLINNLNGRVRVREVRLLLDDGDVVAFGSYGGSPIGKAGDGYDQFSSAFFAALAEVAPGVSVDTEAAILPKFVFALFVFAMGLLVAILAISRGAAVLALGGLFVVAFGLWRGWEHRPWDADRKVVSANEFRPAP